MYKALTNNHTYGIIAMVVLLQFSRFLNLIIPFFSSAMYSIGLCLGAGIILYYFVRKGYSVFLNKNKSIYYFIVCFCINAFISIYFTHGWDAWGLYFIKLSILFLPIYSYLATRYDWNRLLSIIFILTLFLSMLKFQFKGSYVMDNFGGSTAILYLFALFFLKYNKLMKITVFVFFILSFGFDLTDRTHMIMMSLVMILALLPLFPFLMKKSIVNKVRVFLLFLPLILILLAYTDVFNIFSITGTSEFEETFSEGQTVDTRTELYSEVVTDQTNILNIILGKSLSGTYNSSLAEAYELVSFNRNGCEVGILELYLWGGLLFVCLFFNIVFKASLNAIKKSRNVMMRIVALFVCVYWVMMFVELQQGNTSWSIAFWLGIGLCYNDKLLMMNNEELSLCIKNKFGYEAIFKKTLNKVAIS